MRDKQQRRSSASRQIKHQIKYGVTGLFVQIAGRFIGKDKPRLGSEGSAYRNALLLSSR
jgi:hypothetical protein